MCYEIIYDIGLLTSFVTLDVRSDIRNISAENFVTENFAAETIFDITFHCKHRE